MTDSYGFEVRLPATDLATARERVADALAAEGFGVLTEIDVAATLKKKLDVSFRPYVILGACNPKLAHRALGEDPRIGLLLPCNVVLDQQDDGVVVSIVDPRAMFRVAASEALEPIVAEAEARLRRVASALAESGS
ncbi:MAG: DUF302 domain-containing protein [Deltaproteobacteria bacterium]|nr:MAG: DUF302 domain-containing protein [Deltaproteobacteria bacterium]